MTIPQNQSHAFSRKSLDMILEKGRQQLCTPNSPKFVFVFSKEELFKKKTVHIVPSFRVNLLHGSLETRRANWFLHCFFDLLHSARISGLFSQMGQINRVCVFIWNGQRAGELENTGGRRGGGRDVGEGEWTQVGSWGVKVVGVILLLEPVALTLTVAWKPSQSISIHTESGFMWADSSIGQYDRVLVSHGHNFFLTLLSALFASNDFHLFKFYRLLFIYSKLVCVCGWIWFYAVTIVLYIYVCNCAWASVPVCTCDGLFAHVKVEGHHV